MVVTQVKSTGRKDVAFFDADIHVDDLPQFLAPHCEMPWRKSLEILGQRPQRYLDIAGWSPGARFDPPIPGGQPARSAKTAKEMREGLDMLGIDYGLLIPDHLLLFGTWPNAQYATAVSHAYNRWIASEWLEEGNGLFGAILACPQNPDDSVQEIQRYAGVKGMVAVFLPTAGINPLWGNHRYDKILSAAEEADLPVVLHSVGVVANAFPAQLEQFENQFGRAILGHSFAMQANLVSLMHTGVPARHPKLKFAFTEAGIAWVPHIMWRMDKYHQELRRVVPFLEDRPSEYIRRQMFFATQPIEEPDIPAELVETMEHVGVDNIIFASDWPHHDFDHPNALDRLALSDTLYRKIASETALKLFKIPLPAKKLSHAEASI